MHPIITMDNGTEVYVDLTRSLAAKRISRQPHLLGLIKETLRSVTLKGEQPQLQKDLGRVIGQTDIVERSEKDIVFYAQRPHSTTFTPFVKNHPAAQTSSLTMLLQRDEKGNYQLVDTWMGGLRPPFPGESNETEQSKAYWMKHAIVMDGQPIKTSSITKVCPY